MVGTGLGELLDGPQVIAVELGVSLNKVIVSSMGMGSPLDRVVTRTGTGCPLEGIIPSMGTEGPLGVVLDTGTGEVL